MKKYLIAALCLMLVRTGCGTTVRMGRDGGTISVSGYGEAMLEPDYGWFTVSSSVSEPTTEEAKTACTEMIETALDILRDDFGVSDEDIRTDRMSFWPEYKWKDDVRIITGQHAEQQVRVEVRDIERISDIYDAIASVNGISLSGITLDRKDKAEGFEEARTLAVRDAMMKAETYAQAAGLEITGIVSIGNGLAGSVPRNGFFAMDAVAEAAPAAKGASSTFYWSEIKVTDQVQVTVATEGK